MKYFLDTEFLEGPQKKFFFFKTKPTIDLISIALVAEDGREYYAISKEFNLKEAWNRWQQRTGEGDKNIWDPKHYWIRDNVLYPIFKDLVGLHLKYLSRCERIGVSPGSRKPWFFTYRNFKYLLSIHGKNNLDIAKEIVDFVNPNIKDLIYKFTRHDEWSENYYKKEFTYIKDHNTKIPDRYYKSGPSGDGYRLNESLIYNRPDFYAYFADYDWVVFCWLFGKMNDLPNGFPRYCRDLKQMLDDVALSSKFENLDVNFKNLSLDEKIKALKSSPLYPKNINGHNALYDAKFNNDLYNYLSSFKDLFDLKR